MRQRGGGTATIKGDEAAKSTARGSSRRGTRLALSGGMILPLLLLAAPGWAATDPFPVEDALREARAANPEILAARRAAEAAGGMAWGAYSLGEAMVELGREHDAGMDSRTLSLRAELPFPGVSLLAGR